MSQCTTHIRAHFKRIYDSFKFGLVFENIALILIAIYLPPEKTPSYEDNESRKELLENPMIDLKRDYSDYSAQLEI